MKIIMCGSLTASQEILDIRDILLKAGHEVEIPHGVKKFETEGKTYDTESEKTQAKITNDLIRDYYEKIKKHDAVLIVNPEKKGIKGYIGGNTLIEMAFAHVLDKKLYCLYDIPELSYTSEIVTMQPIILHGDIEKISR